MPRILVPLDGSSEAEQILSDASALAGRNGEIILVRVVHPDVSTPIGVSGLHNVKTLSDAYLELAAGPIRAEGYAVRTLTKSSSNESAAIDQAVADEAVDMIACSTHGRSQTGRFFHGSTAWRMVAGSTVPVFLLHVCESEASPHLSNHTSVMVPLDGSPYSEKALPVAENFARQWGSAISLVRVTEVMNAFVGYGSVPPPIDYEAEEKAADAYLHDVAAKLGGDIRTHAIVGSVVRSLVDFVHNHGVTHVVMATHGRTAIDRVIFGSVADQLLHDLPCPIILVPALAAGRLEDNRSVTDSKSGPTSLAVPLSL